MTVLLDRTFLLIRKHVMFVPQENIKTKTIGRVARKIVVLARTLLPIKHHVLLALRDSIKTKAISRSARMIAVLDRTLTLLKLPVSTATSANIKTKTISPVAKIAVQEHTTIRLDKLNASNVSRASSTKTRNKLLNLHVQTAIKASGRMTLDVPRIVNSVAKVHTTMKRGKSNVRCVLLGNITREQERLMKPIASFAKWKRTTMLKVCVKHATTVPEQRLKVL